MALSVLLDAPYFSGSSTSSEVPWKWDVSLNGRNYMIDREQIGEFVRRPIPLLRQQADNSSTFGEQTLSPEDAVRRSQETWHRGAGQTFLDREDSDRSRFLSSKGVDPWTKWELSLLPDTRQARASAAAKVLLEPVGSHLYAVDTALLHTASLAGTPAWTAVTGLPGVPSSLTSDGFTVWTAHGASGIYSTTRGAGAATSYNAVQADLLGYVRGRLMVAHEHRLFNVTAGGAAPTALFAHPNTDFRWVGFAETQSLIYAAGFSGDKSLVYRIGLLQDGTGLDQPIVAGQLPDGEVVRSVGAYLGFVLLGTDRGVRFCAAGADGALTIGALIRTPQPVRCFEGQDRFVWFGWSAFDADSTGLGRMDLTQLIAPLTPAYASDLMATGQGAVTSVVTYAGKRVFGVAGSGVHVEDDVRVPAGSLDTGRLTYGISDSKVAFFLDVRVRDAVGAHRGYVSADGGEFLLAGTRDGMSSDEPFQVGQQDGESFQVRLELLRDDAQPALGPVLTRYTLRAYPRPRRGELFQVPLLLHEDVLVRSDSRESQDPLEEFNSIRQLQDARALVTYQVGVESYTVLVDESVFLYAKPTKNGRSWDGTLLVRLKALAN